MKNFNSLSVTSLLLSLTLIFLSSCSKEPVPDPEITSILSETEISGLTTYTSSSSTCSTSSIPSILAVYSDYVDVGNGKQAKTLKTNVFNTDTHVFVEAEYLVTAENEDLPGKITIDIGGTFFEFTDVNPGEAVEAEVAISEEWFGSYVEVNVKQYVFLEPAEVLVNLYIAEPCPLELGAELMGGIVGHLFQPGDPGYIEGETHGLIVSLENLATMNWSDAMAAAENLELNGYDDWTLPTGNEAVNLLSTLTGEFSYDPLFSYGYWTSVEVDATTALRAEIQQSGLVSEPVTIETSPFNKSYPLEVRVVRKF